MIDMGRKFWKWGYSMTEVNKTFNLKEIRGGYAFSGNADRIFETFFGI